MNKKDTEWNAASVRPASMPASLRSRLAAAMEAAEKEAEADRLLERELAARFKPAQAPANLMEACKAAQGAPQAGGAKPFSRRWRRAGYAAAAAVVVLCCAGGLRLFCDEGGQAEQMAAAAPPAVYAVAERSIAVEPGLSKPCRRILYQDSFVIQGANRTKITIRVPRQENLAIPNEVI